jgi:hypothetical protein
MMKIFELEKIRATAERLKLSGRHLLDNTELCLAECNGIGAEWMGWFCKLLTRLFPVFLVASAIHDIRYYIGGGWQDREAADREFYANSLVLIEDKYHRYNPVRYVAEAVAKRFYYILRASGFVAWHPGKVS